jgi:hypothetical protein
MRSPIDALLDRVDWKCVTCGVSAKVGCDCHAKFDASFEESEEWAKSPSGQAIVRELSPAMRNIVGLKLNEE